MSEKQRDGISVYTSGISSLVTISTAGLAAGTALMQIAGGNAANQNWYLGALISFFIGLIFCFFSMAGLTGQAIVDKPNINVLNIRLPVLVAFILACLGFILLGRGALLANGKKESVEPNKIVAKLEMCRGEIGVSQDQRLKCYDSLFDSQIVSGSLTSEQIQALPESDRLWIKLLIQKIRPKD